MHFQKALLFSAIPRSCFFSLAQTVITCRYENIYLHLAECISIGNSCGWMNPFPSAWKSGLHCWVREKHRCKKRSRLAENFLLLQDVLALCMPLLPYSSSLRKFIASHFRNIIFCLFLTHLSCCCLGRDSLTNLLYYVITKLQSKEKIASCMKKIN